MCCADRLELVCHQDCLNATPPPPPPPLHQHQHQQQLLLLSVSLKLLPDPGCFDVMVPPSNKKADKEHGQARGCFCLYFFSFGPVFSDNSEMRFAEPRLAEPGTSQSRANQIKAPARELNTKWVGAAAAALVAACFVGVILPVVCNVAVFLH